MYIFFKRTVHCILCMVSFFTVNAQTIHQIGFYDVNGTYAITAKPNYFFIAGETGGAAVDISKPVAPALKSKIKLDSIGTSVFIEGDYAYFGTGMGTGVKLVIADVSNPAIPVYKSTLVFYQALDQLYGIVKKNEVVYVAAGTSGVFSIDVSNKTNPVILDTIPIPVFEEVRDIVLKDNIVYTATSTGLEVIDIGIPAKLKVIGTVGGNYRSIDIQNNWVFLGKDSGGIDVYDISNPNSPTFVFSVPNAGDNAFDIKVKNNLVYLATNSLGLFIYKIQNNSAVEMAHFYDVSNGQCFSVALQDDLILLAGLIKGIAVLKYDSLGVGVPDEKQFVALSIFPNPAKNYIELNKANNSTGELEIRNMQGQLLLSEVCKNTNTRIDISAFAKGDYLVTYKDKEQVLTRKLVKVE